MQAVAADAADGRNPDLDLDLDGPAGPGGDPKPPPQREAGSEASEPPVEDFDQNMPMDQRLQRMRACLMYTSVRMQTMREEVDEIVRQIQEMRQSSKEQAISSIVFTWMMTCYMNIDADAVENLDPEREVPAEIFASNREGAPQQVSQASRKQWQLLESVLAEVQQQRNMEGAGGRAYDMRSQTGERAGGGARAWFTGLAALAAVFLVAAVPVGLLLQSASKNKKGDDGSGGKSAKSLKKAEKEEKKARKRIG